MWSSLLKLYSVFVASGESSTGVILANCSFALIDILLSLSSVDLLCIAVLSIQNVERLCMKACLKLQFRGTGSLWLLWHLSFYFKRLTGYFLYPGVNCAWKRWVSLREKRNNSLLTGKRSFHENCHKHFEMSMQHEVSFSFHISSWLHQNEEEKKDNQTLKNLTVKTWTWNKNNYSIKVMLLWEWSNCIMR